MYNEPWDGTSGEIHHEAINGKRYVSNKVYWFIKEDEYYDSSAIHNFFRLVKLGQAKQGWTEKFVESAQNDRGWEFLCDVETGVREELLSPSTEGVKEKFKRLFRSNSYLQIDYKIRPTISRTGFKVEIFFKDDKIGSSPHIRYRWNESNSDTTNIKWEDLPMKGKS